MDDFEGLTTEEIKEMKELIKLKNSMVESEIKKSNDWWNSLSPVKKIGLRVFSGVEP